MLKFPVLTLAAGLCLLPAAAPAAAQESGAVRERRAATQAEAPKPEAAEDERAKAEAEGDAGADVEGLRARAEGESDAGARGRLRRELAERMAAAGQRAEAAALLRELLAEERFDPPHFYNVGNQLARLGESGAAVEAYRKAVGQRRGRYSRAQHNLGVVLARLGRWDEAEEALKAALRHENHTYAEASYNLGRLHALRGEAGLAIEEWRRTLRIKPGHADAAAALARALAEDGDVRAGLAVLDSFKAGRDAAVPREITVARGELVAAANLLDEERRSEAGAGGASPLRASAASLRASSVSPETYELLRRARRARESAKPLEAAALFRESIRTNGGYLAPANLELGYALAEAGRTREAIESLLLVVRRSGTRYPVAFYHLGRFYEHAGQLAEAGESFARAAELLGEGSPQVYADLSRVREKEGKRAEALAAIESYVRAMSRLGAAPDWALARLDKLKQPETKD